MPIISRQGLVGGSGQRGPAVFLLRAVDGAEGPGCLEELREAARALVQGVGAACSSRSYRHPLAVVALSERPVGIDIERVLPFDRDRADSILTPDERRLGLSASGALLSSIWSSKEALAKALGDARDYDPRRLESPLFWPDGRSGRWRARRLEGLEADLVGWVCWQAHAVGIHTTASVPPPAHGRSSAEPPESCTK